jgi:hypothetical protein
LRFPSVPRLIKAVAGARCSLTRRANSLGADRAIRRRGRSFTKLEVVKQILDVWKLTQPNIAETARICRVARDTVKRVITEAHPGSLGKVQLGPGEELLPEPIDCEDCHRIIIIAPCRTCKKIRGLADLQRLQQLAAGAKARPAKRPRPSGRDAPGQLLLPLETVDGPYQLTDLQPHGDGFNLKPRHARRLDEVRRHRRTHGIPFDGEMPY